jgi:arsenate reductase
MSEVVVWGIPSCSTVKKARAFLEANGVAHRFADLRAAPPSPETVARWVKAFGTKALRNTSGGSYRALPADKDTWDDARWIAAFTADPMLIKRPVIERAGAPATVGFREADVRRAVVDAAGAASRGPSS